ncbi:MAG: hypothetical protein GKR91_12945 [Pseudomonadales bacterium]|nr:hypothetical protein [Pseudomonadales bacterium]
MNVTALVIILYLGAFVVFGLYLNSKKSSAADWAIGGSTLGIFMIAAGAAGTRIGGAGTYGVAGDVIAEGVGHMWYGFNSFAALFLVGLFFAVPYRRLKVVSVGQVFDRRFGSYRCQWLTSLCVQAEYLVVNIIEPYIIGTIISGFTGIPFPIAVAMGGALIISFTVFGGLKGTAYANIVHCSVIIFGLLLVGLTAMNNMGGWDVVVERTSEQLAASGGDEVAWWSYTGIGIATIVAMFISATIHTPAASVYANYASSAKKEDFLLPGFFFAGVIAAAMPFVAGFIGILTMASYGSDSGLSSYLNIAQLAIDGGEILGGIALAAILAAVISSGAPILLASSTMFVNDWIPSSKNFTPEKKLRWYKVVAVIYGTGAALIAWLGNITSVLGLVLIGFALVVPPAVAVAFVIYWRRTSEKAAFWGMASGFGGGLLMWLFNVLFDGPENATAGGFAQWYHELYNQIGAWSDPAFATLFFPMIVVPLFTILFPNDEKANANFDKFYGTLGRIQRNFKWTTESS